MCPLYMAGLGLAYVAGPSTSHILYISRKEIGLASTYTQYIQLYMYIYPVYTIIHVHEIKVADSGLYGSHLLACHQKI